MELSCGVRVRNFLSMGADEVRNLLITINYLKKRSIIKLE